MGPVRRLFSALLLCLAAVPSARAEELARRTAVIIGADDGGEGSRPLHYAISDAERIHRILTTVGGIAPEDATLLRQPKADEIIRALDAADQRADGGTLFFYFSGHARDGDLRLGSTPLPLTTLRAKLASLKARTKIAVLDSCRSGELIRAKGGRIAPAFEVTDDTSGPMGLAVVASSASDEDSQESDLLGASFFTHFLASGLLGDADANADGRVSLQEAYDYAYGRTVVETAQAGVTQHPTYQYRLTGAGDLWLTDIARSKSTLVLGESTAGSYVIVDANRRTLVAEVSKEAATTRRIALPAGGYEVKRRDGDGALFTRVKLSDGDVITLNDTAMTHVAVARNLNKGTEWAGDLARVRPVRWMLGGAVSGQFYFAGATRSGLFPNMPMGGFELQTRDLFESRQSVLGVDVGAGSAPLTVRIGSQNIDTRITEWTFGFSYLYELLHSWFQPYVGARLSGVGALRTFSSSEYPSQSLFTMAPGVVAGINFDVVPHLSVGVRARASYLLYAAGQDMSLGYADAGLVLRWEL